MKLDERATARAIEAYILEPMINGLGAAIRSAIESYLAALPADDAPPVQSLNTCAERIQKTADIEYEALIRRRTMENEKLNRKEFEKIEGDGLYPQLATSLRELSKLKADIFRLVMVGPWEYCGKDVQPLVLEALQLSKHPVEALNSSENIQTPSKLNVSGGQSIDKYDELIEKLEALKGKKPDEGLGCHYDSGVDECVEIIRQHQSGEGSV